MCWGSGGKLLINLFIEEAETKMKFKMLKILIIILTLLSMNLSRYHDMIYENCQTTKLCAP